MPPKPGGTLRAAGGLQVPGTAPPAVIRAARSSHARLTAYCAVFAGLPTGGSRAASLRRLPRKPTITIMTTIMTTTTTTIKISFSASRSRYFWGGDTSPRGELPRPATGAAISPTPPDTRRPALPRAHSAAAACAAIQRRAPRQLTPRPRRPVARTTGLGVAAGARLASLCPSPYGRRRAFRRRITPEGLPQAILTAQACCGVAVAGPPPFSYPRCGSRDGCHAH